MKLQMSRRLELSELAEVVVSCHSPGPGAVDLAKILQENAIKLHSASYPEDFDAVLVPGRAGFHIHLNLRKVDGDPDAPRARFSIAHELGHYFLDDHRTRLLTEAPHPSVCGLFDGNERNEEDEADHFAANLIMPPSRFRAAVNSTDTPINSILNLTRAFGASVTATAIQYVNHVSDRSMAIRWKPDGEMAWAVPGRGYRAEGYRTVLFKDTSKLPRDSASASVIAGRNSQDRAVLTMGTVFQNVALAGDRNTFVTEECISLGDYGCLTIISDFRGEVEAVSERARRRQERNGVGNPS